MTVLKPRVFSALLTCSQKKRTASWLLQNKAEAVAAMVYAEMVRNGYTHVAEFQYLHHDKDGKPYANLSEMGERMVAAARASGYLWAEGTAQRVWAQALSILEPPPSTEVDLHFAESLRVFDEGGARLEAARTQIAWGKTLVQRSETQLASEHFKKAAAQFETSGLMSELDEV